MKKRVISPPKCRPAAVLTVALCAFLLSACASVEEKIETTPAQTTATTETPAQTPPSPDIAAGYQFVSGYGIVGPNNPRVYQKDPVLRPGVEGEDASAELLYAVYQDGGFRCRYKVVDTSIEIIPEDEMRELLEKEEENRKSQDQGAAIEMESDYFAIDEEKEIYGRSAYQSRVSKIRSDEPVQFGLNITSVTGKKLLERGTRTTAATTSRDYREFLEKGYVNSCEEYFIRGNQPEGWTPTEMYRMSLMGFSEPMEFTLAPAPEYPSLDQIPGMTKVGDYWILAQAETGDNELAVTTYTWPKEGHKLTGLMDQKLEYQTEGGSGICREKQRNNRTQGQDELKGIPEGIQGSTTIYDLSDAGAGAAFTITSPTLSIHSEESPEITTIPIPPAPDQVLRLDQQIRLKDCTIKLTEVRRSSEDVYYGNINGEDVMKPALYVDFEAETNNDDLQIEFFSSFEKESGMFSGIIAYTEDEDSNVPRSEQKIKDLLVFFQEGDQEVSFRIDSISYRLNREIRVPVVMED